MLFWVSLICTCFVTPPDYITMQVSYAGLIGGGLTGGVSSPTNWCKGGVQGACLGLGLAVFAQMMLKPVVITV